MILLSVLPFVFEQSFGNKVEPKHLTHLEHQYVQIYIWTGYAEVLYVLDIES